MSTDLLMPNAALVSLSRLCLYLGMGGCIPHFAEHVVLRKTGMVST